VVGDIASCYRSGRSFARLLAGQMKMCLYSWLRIALLDANACGW
jgi:hypothetical protein